MPTVTVIKVTEAWPPDIDGNTPLSTVDLTVDAKYVRMGYLTAELTSAADVQAKLTADTSVITSAGKQQNNAFTEPSEGTDRPDLVPAPFVV